MKVGAENAGVVPSVVFGPSASLLATASGYEVMEVSSIRWECVVSFSGARETLVLCAVTGFFHDARLRGEFGPLPFFPWRRGDNGSVLSCPCVCALLWVLFCGDALQLEGHLH